MNERPVTEAVTGVMAFIRSRVREDVIWFGVPLDKGDVVGQVLVNWIEEVRPKDESWNAALERGTLENMALMRLCSSACAGERRRRAREMKNTVRLEYEPEESVPEAFTTMFDRQANMTEAMRALTYREHVMVFARMNGGTFEEIGKLLGVSDERARQIYCSGLSRLARLLHAYAEEKYEPVQPPEPDGSAMEVTQNMQKMG